MRRRRVIDDGFADDVLYCYLSDVLHLVSYIGSVQRELLESPFTF